jgi:integrase
LQNFVPRPPRPSRKFTNRDVTQAKPGKLLVWDTPGLYLITRPDGRQRWTHRYSRTNGRGVTEIGIGHMPYVDLAKARLAVMEHKHFLRLGEDPQDRRRLSKDQQTTFAQAADAYIENQKPRWRNPSSLRDAKLLLKVYAKPFEKVGVAHVTPNMIEDALALIPSPAQQRRALRVWERTFDFALAKGFSIPKGNPARWKGFMEYRLPHLKSIEHKHLAEMPYEQIPQFMKQVRQRQGRSTAATALEFLILTACRRDEVREMQWPEINWDQRTWTIPAERMLKTEKPHIVPLVDRTIELLRRQEERRQDGSPYVFIGYNGTVLAEKSMLELLRTMDDKATVHGFRTAFRDWCGDETQFKRNVVEACLSHQVGNAVERAYRRRTALDKRREIMQAWASYCEANSTTIPIT